MTSGELGAGRTVDRGLTWARRLLIGGLIAWAVTYAAMWLPVFLTGSQASLFLYPIALGVVFLLAVAAVVAIVLAIASRATVGRKAVLIFLGILLVLIPLPTVWFGRLPFL